MAKTNVLDRLGSDFLFAVFFLWDGQHRKAASGCTTPALVLSLQLFSELFIIDDQTIIIVELLTPFDIALGNDMDALASLALATFAVWLTRVIDPAGFIALVIPVNDFTRTQ